MGKHIVPYPRITSTEALKKLGVDVSWSLSSNGKDMAAEQLNSDHYVYQCRITDKTWYPDLAPLTVEVGVAIRNAIRLFSGIHDNNGCEVADRRSCLGIALRWSLPEMNLQGVEHCREVSFTRSSGLSFRAALNFQPLTIRFRLVVDVILYLRQNGTGTRGVYAKTPGTVLGPLARFELITGGSGGYFPTVTEDVYGGPLWRIEANIDDADDFKEDFCEEFFCLVLNRRHPLFPQVYITSKDGKLLVSPLMFEIFVNACVVLIQKACRHFTAEQDWELSVEEKDEQTIAANFKALKRSCLPGKSKKELLDMNLEELMLEVRKGLAKYMKIDLDGGSPK